MQPARKPASSQAHAAPAAARLQRLEARLPAELKALYTTAAALRGQTLTDFVLSTVTEAAQRIVRESELVEWSRRDQQAFAAALLAPPPPTGKLRAAAAWAREQAGDHD